MMSVASKMEKGKSRTSKAQRMLQQSYEHLFEGNGTPDEAEIVLSDLARHSGYYNTAEPTVTPNELLYREGKRALFGRILQFLNLPDEARDQLNAAVMRENAASQESNGLEI